MWDVLKQDARTGATQTGKLVVAGLLALAAIMALSAAIEPYVSPLVLCLPLLLSVILAIRSLGRRRLWDRHGKMPPLQREDIRRVRSKLVTNKMNRTYERHLRDNSGCDRGRARS